MKQKKQNRILVVDDDPINIEILSAIFSGDYMISFATTGLKALEIAAKVHPDLILLDVMMPGIDGFEVCRQLKGHQATNDIPIIFVTGHLDPAMEIEGLEIGAVDYITKPINVAVVRARVRTHLSLMHAMNQIKEFNNTLESQVEQRTSELRTALESYHRSQEELADSQAKATMSTLVASFSHELITPIGNSMLTSDSLNDNADKLLDLVESGQLKRSDLAAFLTDLRLSTDLLQRNLSRARELVKNFNQVAADQASSQRRRFDLAIAVQEILATLAPRLKTKPHRVVLEIPAGISMDSLPGPLGQVVINLVNNAYLHAFEGRNDGVVTISAVPGENEVRLLFSDNGIGIPETNLAHLFEPFYSTKIGHGGTGLGMVIVKNIVCKSLGGSLTVQSTEQVGTTVTVRLPLVGPATRD